MIFFIFKNVFSTCWWEEFSYFNITLVYSICCRYKDVWIGEPSVIIDGVTEKLTPHQCRLSDITWVSIVVLLSYLVIRTCHRKPEGYIFWILLSCCCMSIKFGRWTRFLKLKKIFWFSRKNYNTSDAAKEVIEEAKWCKWSSKQFLSWLFSQFFLSFYAFTWSYEIKESSKWKSFYYWWKFCRILNQ